MCGILGMILPEKGNLIISKERFESLIGLLRHRGPDNWGVVFDDAFYFGHTRLRITDLSEAANQPMCDADKKIFIVYNGEIYNFIQIRSELIEKGHVFQNNSDTEVIIEAYKEWGIECVNRFNGMFAFGLFDKVKHKLFLVRDRLGIKPLYYSLHKNNLLFSSELKGILNFPFFRRKINYKAVSCFLSYRYVLGNETLFEDIYQLEPGCILEYSKENAVVRKYWNINLEELPKPVGQTSRKSLKALIAEAVNLTLSGDVEVGTLLSGGLDSSIILFLISQAGVRRKSFTAKFGESGFDETYYSTLAARKYNSFNKVITISSEDYLKNFKEYIKYKDQPVGMHNEVATYLLAKEVKKSVSVVLSGEGADELFSGYGRIFRSPFDYEKRRFVNNLLPVLRTPLQKALNIKQPTGYASDLVHFISSYTYFPLSEKKKIFNDKMIEAVNEDQYSRNIFTKCFEECANRNYYDKVNYAFVKHHLPGLLLMMDSTTMASGLELRVPFLDHRLVEASFQIPYDQKIKWRSFVHKIRSVFYSANYISERFDEPKYILKRLFKHDLPGEIIKRKKMGFPAPLNAWFKNDFKNIINSELLNEEASINDIFDHGRLKKWICESKEIDNELFGKQLLLILNLEYWLREYF